MNTGELLLILLALLLVQVGGFALFGLWRRRRLLGGGAGQAGAVAPGAVLPRTTAADTAAVGWPGFREFEVRRKVYESADRSICSFYLSPLDGAPLPRFRPGQFLTFRLDLAAEDGSGTESVVRCYSLSDAPGRDDYRVSIKRVAAPPKRPDLPPGRASSYFHDQVEVGDRLAVRAPSGQFFLQQEDALPVVLIAGGIGITPLLSMLGALLEQGTKRDIRLFYGVRNGAEAAMGEALRKWARAHDRFHFHLCFSAPTEADRSDPYFYHAGRVAPPLLRNSLPLRRHRFYLCGPPSMMESLISGLEAWGVEAGDVFYESFGPASPRRKAPPAPAESATPPPLVTFNVSGKSIPWDPAAGSLLEFAEANGIEAASSCRAGSCGCCQTALSQGAVAYHHEPDAEPDPGHCLLCISTPRGAVTLEV